VGIASSILPPRLAPG